MGIGVGAEGRAARTHYLAPELLHRVSGLRTGTTRSQRAPPTRHSHETLTRDTHTKARRRVNVAEYFAPGQDHQEGDEEGVAQRERERHALPGGASNEVSA